MAGPPGQQDLLNTLAAPAKAVMDIPQIAETVHKGVATFMDAVPPLMKALDEVAKIHPFISGKSPLHLDLHYADHNTSPYIVVVIAFKAVYTLEKKRRDNDKRILSLYAECVKLGFDLLPSSHKFQNERYDDSTPPVRFVCLHDFAP